MFMNQSTLNKGLLVLFALALIPMLTLISCSDDDEVVNPTTGDSLVITVDPVQILTEGSNPTVSGDGSWLAYSAGGGIINTATTSGASITQIADSAYDPCWSQALDLIVYRNYDSLIVVNQAGVRQWTGVADLDDSPEWSPTGDRIVVQCDDGARIVEYPSGTSSVIPCTYQGGICDGEYPTWSGDGQWVAFEDGLQIAKIPTSGGAAQTVVDEGRDVSWPAWSPDGRCIVFSMEDDEDFREMHLWLVDLQTNKLWQLTSGSVLDGSPAWTSDSRTVYFERREPSGDWFYEDRGIWKLTFTFVDSE